MSGYQNFCDFYVSLVPHHENLKKQCHSLTNVLKDEKDRRQDAKKEQFRLNVQAFLKEFIDKMYEKLELLKMMAYGLGIEYVTYQCNLKSIENESQVYQDKLNVLNGNIDDLHKVSNAKIKETRDEFLKKYSELIDFKKGNEEMQKILDESCKEQMDIEKQLTCKRNELKRVLCKIKAHRDKMEPNVEISDFDHLRDSYEKVAHKLNQLSSSVNCIQTKIAQAEKEGCLMRKCFRSKLKVIKVYDSWTTKDLIKRKNMLEKRLEGILPDESDHEIKKIEREILNMQEKIEMSEVSIDELAKVVSKFQAWKRPCLKVSTGLVRKPKEPDTFQFGTDYLGSKFVIPQ